MIFRHLLLLITALAAVTVLCPTAVGAVVMPDSDFNTLMMIRDTKPEVAAAWNVTDLRNCNATGVTCNSTTGYVTSFNLQPIKMTVTASRNLSLDVNFILGLSSNLVELILHDLGASGSIQPGWPARFPDLRTLRLAYNNIGGPIPRDFGQFEKLGWIDLEMNAIENPLPIELANITGLTRIELSRNQLRCPVPRDVLLALEAKSNFEYLSLQSNFFTEDGYTICTDVTDYNKTRILPVLHSSAKPPSVAPKFTFESERVLVQIFDNRVFAFGKGARSGRVETEEHLMMQFQGIQIINRGGMGYGYEEVFPPFSSYYVDPVTKMIHLQSNITSGGIMEFVLVINTSSPLLRDDTAIKFSFILKNHTFRGIPRENIEFTAIPTMVFFRVPHTTNTSSMTCSHGSVVPECKSDILTFSNFFHFGYGALAFVSTSQRVNTTQYWSSTEFKIDGSYASSLDVNFADFDLLLMPFGTASHYRDAAAAARANGVATLSDQGVGYGFRVVLTRTFQLFEYDPDVSLTVLFDYVDPPALAGDGTFAMGVGIGTAVAFLVAGIAITVSIVIIRRNKMKMNEDRERVQKLLQSPTQQPTATIEQPAQQPPPQQSDKSRKSSQWKSANLPSN